MKTFTTYAEKKAKQILNLLQEYTKGIRMTAILILLLMGVSNAWATNGTISGGSIIYLNCSIWDQASAWFSVYFMDANKSSTKFVSMQKVTGNYYYAEVPTGTWTYVIFVRNNPIDKIADWTNVWNQTADLNTQSYKNLYTITGWDGNNGSWGTYQPSATGSLGASSSNNVAKNTDITLTPSISPTTYNVLKSTSYSISPSSGATISNNTFKATAGGSYTVTATITYNAKGFTNITKTATAATTITVKPTITFNANGGSGSMSAQTVSYNTNTTLSANTFTAPVGYTFNGWNTKTDGTGTAYAAGTSYKFTSDLTLYAQWKINTYTVSYGVCSTTRWGSIQLNSETAITTTGTKTLNYGTSISFTAKPNTGYQVEGWYSNSDCTSKITAAGTSEIYNAGTLTANKTVYVKFEAIPANSHNITYTEEGTGWTYGNSNPTTAEEGATVTFVVNPTVGYRVSVSSDGPALTGPNANNQYTFTMPSKDVEIDVTATEILSTITIDTNPAEGGSVKVDGEDFVSGNTVQVGVATTKIANITAKAIFSINQYTLTFTAGEGGHVSATANNSAIASPATLDYNTSVTLTAEPSANCVFDKWVDENGNEIKEGNKSIGATYTFNLTANKTVKATFTKGTTIFFKPVDYWKEADARFAVYTWGGSAGDKWIEFEDYGCNEDIFTAEIPAGYTGFKIVRLKPASADGYNSDGDGLNWGNRWAETVNLTIPKEDKNLYDMTVTQASTKLYFTPHDNWKQADARFAAYFFGNGVKWVDLTHHNDGIYACDKPSGYTQVIFGRMNPATKDNNFNNGVKWNQTSDITLPTNGQNHYILTEGEWDGVTGEWHTAWDDRQWTTYAAPSYKLTIQSTANGTVAVSKVGGDALDNNAAIKLGDKITITFTPEEGNELSNYLINYASETETDGVYTVCGPTKIIAEFDPIAPSRTVYLRPNEDWLRDNPIMAAYAYNNSGNRWYVMNTTDDDYTGAYSCKIPSAYDKVIFVRLNPNGSDKENDGFNFNNAWNQTKDLTIIDKDNDKTNDHKLRFAIGDKIVGGNDNDKYDGKWEENTPIWGMLANFNDWQAVKAIFMGYPGKLNVEPPYTPQHAFKLLNLVDSTFYGNSGTMQRANSEQWWTMDVNEQANCQMKLDAKGDYIYQLRFLTAGPELRKQISVTYPEATNVYTLLYEYTIDSQTKSRMSYEIAAVAGEKLDTVSFHVLKNASPQITLLKNSERQEEPISISVESDSVYNFVLQQTDGQARLLNADYPEVYTGNYYVRTDAATGGWNAYKQAGNKMTYSSYADKNQSFDHYYCKWVESPETGNNQANVKFCVANNYSHALSDELNGDEIIEKVGIATGCLPDSVNVRFAWDSQTNELSRAYISGSAYAKDRFLVLTGNEYLKDIEGGALNISGLKANEALFADKQNWIYQLDVQANSDTEITLTAQYNGKVQTFFGNAKSAAGGEPIMQATNDDNHKVRMIYDFKTNNLIAAWLLDETQYPETTSVASNMLIIRENQGVANQINFSNIDNDDMTIQTAYAVMTFTKNHVLGLEDKASLSKWQRTDYWVSFPFDVNLSDVFGFSEYGDKWIMLLYDGAERAEKGNWIDSPTFWKYITNRNYTLEAGVGYVLKLNLNKMDFPNNSTDASLFFPSTPDEDGHTIINAEPTSITVPAHTCTIERDNRNIKDSHWNLIGVPGFANLENINTGDVSSTVTIDNVAHNLTFYYAYDPATNTYDAEVAQETFKNMHAYMVQYAGTIDWTNLTNAPQQIAARRNADAGPEKVSLNLELAQDDITADKTFIQLQEEGATADFDMNVDMCKIINAGANIYTLVGEGQIEAAGNVLPMNECEVPVGVKVDAAGEYTFRMPDGTEGMVVELIDYYTNTRTNLLLFDYTITLPAGTSEDRFALHIQPTKSGVATDIDQLTGSELNADGVQKYIIDGCLYLKKDGVLYDAQGHIVR